MTAQNITVKKQNPFINSINIYLFSSLLFIFSTAFLFTSCTMQGPSYSDKAQQQKQPDIFQPDIKKTDEKNIYSGLEQQGDSKIKSGDYRSALNIYNNLLTKYSGDDKSRLLDKIDALLSLMKINDLELVLKSSKSMIPKSMLIYRIGMKYLKTEENDKAKEMLAEFLSSYPDDSHASEVKAALKELEKKSFSKNTIGCMLPLSGKYQIIGKQALRGIQMAQEDIKALYKDQAVEFIIKDTESNDDKAVQCVQELAKENVAAIAGPIASSEAGAKEAQKYQIPMVCMTQKSEVTAAGDFIFSNFITPEMQIRGLISHAVNVIGIGKFAVLYPNDKYGQTFMALFRETAAQSGAEVIFSEVYSSNQTDFADIIKKLAALIPEQSEEQALQEAERKKEAERDGSYDNSSSSPHINSKSNINPESNPDIGSNSTNSNSNLSNKIAVFIPDSPNRVAVILPQLMYYNVQNHYLLGTNIWHNESLLKIDREHVRNTIITDGYFAQSTKPEAARFAQAFKTAYGEYPGFIEAIAYDTVSMLVKIAMDQSVDSRLSLKDALAGNIIYNGVTGETMFETNGNARKELFFLTIENGAFVEINR